MLQRRQPSMLDRKALAARQREAQEREENRAAELADAADSDDETTPDLAAFRDRNRAEQQRFKDATDTECWVAITFKSRADKDAFIAEFGLIDHPLIPGTPGNKYVNGYSLAEHLRRRSTP
jgi:hypothetical protein